MKKSLNVFVLTLGLLWLGIGCATKELPPPSPPVPIAIEVPEVPTEDSSVDQHDEPEGVITPEAPQMVADEPVPVHFSLAFTPQSQADLDAAALLSKIVFIGIENISIRYAEDGHAYLDIILEYDNMSGKPITISEMVLRAIFMDETTTKRELTTYAYSDFCDTSVPGCQLRDIYKKYDCGFYVPKTSMARLSQIYKAGQNEEHMTFDFGKIFDNRLDAYAQERLKVDGYSKDTQFMVIQEPMTRLLRLYNTMNGPYKNDGKFVLLGEGVANYNDQSGTVRLGKVFIAAVLDRIPIMFIYTNPRWL